MYKTIIFKGNRVSSLIQMKKLIIGCGLRDGLFSLDAYKDFKLSKIEIQNKDLII